MARSHLDHITLTAPSLAAGVEYVHQTLGVMPQVGGEHPRMGTHNYFLRLGETVYLEIIAVNPEGAPPKRPRWFQLDELAPEGPPRLTTWVVRTDDISAAVAVSRAPLGAVEPMSRGQFNWLITIPLDGSLPFDGVAPTLIQWPAGSHPTNMLQHSGCSLVRLEGFHAEAESVRRVLDCIGFEGEFSVSPLAPGERPYLVAHIQTPKGIRRLCS
jgi:Glyoxalase-like domain